MADFNNPILTSTYSDMVDELKNRDIDSIKWLDGTSSTNLPTGAKRWNATNSYFEKFDGTTWSPLVAKYLINVDQLDGCSVNDNGNTSTDLWTASKITNLLNTKLNTTTYTASDILNKLKTVDGSGSGLDADLLDGKNANTGSVGNTVVVRDASGNFSANQITASLIGNANTATTASRLTTPRQILLWGDVDGSFVFDGSGSVNVDVIVSSVQNLNPSVFAFPNTLTTRDNSGDITTRLFKSTSTVENTDINYIMTQVDKGSLDGRIMPSSLGQVVEAMNVPQKTSNQVLHPTDALRSDNRFLYLHKGDGTLEYIDLAVSFTQAQNGYQKLPSGLIIQWGNAQIDSSGIVNSSGSNTLPWNLAFPTGCAWAIGNSLNLDTTSNLTSTNPISDWKPSGWENLNPAGSGTYAWIAIGY
jgi:hypothetical protein